MTGERWAAEGVQVLCERGDEIGLPPAVAMDEDGRLRGEEETTDSERDDRKDVGSAGADTILPWS